jgi:hypothetical protein
MLPLNAVLAPRQTALAVPMAIVIAVVCTSQGMEADGRDQGPSPPATDIVASFLNRREPPVTSYRALRRLEAKNERLSKEGWLEAVTELGPGGFTYQVVAEGGSDAVRRRVLKAALDAEREMVASSGASAFTTANYRLTADGVEGELARIRVTPVRSDKRLVDGWLLVSPRDLDLVAVKGRLAKSPSFWTSQVDVLRRYARIAGVRVPVVVESTASVKLAGQSTFRMNYTYETINGVKIAR